MNSSHPVDLVVHKSALTRLRSGHLWIYGNELATPPARLGLGPGAAVRVFGPRGEPIGRGYFNPHTLIAVRLLSADVDARIDADWFATRIDAAWQLRRRLGRGDFGRIVYGEADGLPGLVVDRYGAHAVGQIGTAGMEIHREVIAEVLRAQLGLHGLLWKNTTASRALEGLPSETVLGFGQVPEVIQVPEAGVRFEVPLGAGQKTGWFYDQRDNRSRILPLLAGRRVLDLYCYLGGWGLGALAQGAAEAVLVDASERALEHARRTAERHGWDGRVQLHAGDAVETLQRLARAGERFAAVIVDPPAFIKRRKDLAEGTQAYRRVNEWALRLLEPGGLLVSCSCSHHYGAEALLDGVARAAVKQGRVLRILAELGQSADHPLHPAMPETRYLKGVLAEVHTRY